MQIALYFAFTLFVSVFQLHALAFSHSRYPLNFIRSPSLLGDTLSSVANVASGADGVLGDATTSPKPESAVPESQATADADSPPAKPPKPGLDLGIISVGSDSKGGVDVGLLGNDVDVGPSGVDAKVNTPIVKADVGLSASGVKAKVDTPLASADVGLDSSGLEADAGSPLLGTASIDAGPSGLSVDAALKFATVDVVASPSGVNVNAAVPGITVGAGLSPSGFSASIDSPIGTGSIVIDSSGVHVTGPSVTIDSPTKPTDSKPGTTILSPPSAPTEGNGGSGAESSNGGDDAPPSSSSPTISISSPDGVSQPNQSSVSVPEYDPINRRPGPNGGYPPARAAVNVSSPSGSWLPNPTSGTTSPGQPDSGHHKGMAAGIIAIAVLAVLLLLAICLSCFLRRYRRKLKAELKTQFWGKFFEEAPEKAAVSEKRARETNTNWRSPSQMRAPSYGAVGARLGDPVIPPVSSRQRSSVTSAASGSTGSYLSTAPDLDSPISPQDNGDDLFFGTAPSLSRNTSQSSAQSLDPSASVDSSHTFVLVSSQNPHTNPFADPPGLGGTDIRMIQPPKIITTSSSASFRQLNGGDTQILYVPGDVDSLATTDSGSLRGYRESSTSYGSSTLLGDIPSKENDGYGYGYGRAIGKGAWRESDSSAASTSTVTPSRSRSRPESGRTFGSLSSDESEDCSTDESTNESLSRVVWKFQ